MNLDLSGKAIEARLREASRLAGTLSPETRLSTKIDMSARAVEARLRRGLGSAGTVPKTGAGSDEGFSTTTAGPAKLRLKRPKGAATAKNSTARFLHGRVQRGMNPWQVGPFPLSPLLLSSKLQVVSSMLTWVSSQPMTTP
jgi:hypothetical protein